MISRPRPSHGRGPWRFRRPGGPNDPVGDEAKLSAAGDRDGLPGLPFAFSRSRLPCSAGRRGCGGCRVTFSRRGRAARARRARRSGSGTGRRARRVASRGPRGRSRETATIAAGVPAPAPSRARPADFRGPVVALARPARPQAGPGRARTRSAPRGRRLPVAIGTFDGAVTAVTASARAPAYLLVEADDAGRGRGRPERRALRGLPAATPAQACPDRGSLREFRPAHNPPVVRAGGFHRRRGGDAGVFRLSLRLQEPVHAPPVVSGTLRRHRVADRHIMPATRCLRGGRFVPHGPVRPDPRRSIRPEFDLAHGRPNVLAPPWRDPAAAPAAHLPNMEERSR